MCFVLTETEANTQYLSCLPSIPFDQNCVYYYYTYHHSDAEIRFLQMARGASAKTQLCWYWLSEFVIREHLNGSTGKVGPPIISRIIQFLGDGMIYYNHARKIMFIPFPFPHAQLSVLFILVSIPSIAFLMDQYSDNVYVGCLLSFFSVACIAGIHEVARELENPFRNIPNELPLVTFQAQFNEALLIMYSGYHPDHFWDPRGHNHHPSDPRPPKRQNSKHRSTQSPRTAPNLSGSTHNVKSNAPPSRPPSTTPVETSPPETATTTPTAAAVVAAASPSPSVAANGKNGGELDLAKMQQTMEEYGQEIQRLRALLENSEDKKSN